MTTIGSVKREEPLPMARSRERGPARFTEAEVTRGVKSVINGGGKVRSVVIRDNGNSREIRIECGEDDNPESILEQLK
jgi:hypothetical protein